MSTELTVIILAAGQGTRMKSRLPKVLHKIAGLPMLGHVIKAAEALNPTCICVVTNPALPEVASAAAPHLVAHQDKALGTGHALKCAIEQLPELQGDILMLYGDVPLLSSKTLEGFLMHHQQGGFGATVLAFVPPDAKGYGRIFQNGDGTLARIVEEADATDEERMVRLCNAGPLLLKADGLSERLGRLTPKNAQGELYVVDLPKILNDDGIPCGVIRGEYFELRGINDRAQLAELELGWQHLRRLQTMRDGVTLQDPNTVYFQHDTIIAPDVTIGANVVFGPNVKVASGVEIRPFCHLESVTIAENAIIGPFARLRPGTKIGADAHIGNFVEIKNATIADGAKINHLAYVGDADVGAKSNIGAGVITANYDGFDKHRTVIGANVMIGSNANLIAPVTVGDGAYVAAGSTITKNVPEDALAVCRPQQDIKPGWAASYRKRKQQSKTNKDGV